MALSKLDSQGARVMVLANIKDWDHWAMIFGEIETAKMSVTFFGLCVYRYRLSDQSELVLRYIVRLLPEFRQAKRS